MSLQPETPQTEKDIAMYVVKRLFMADFRARDVTIEPSPFSPVPASTENVSIFSLVADVNTASISDESADSKMDSMDILMCLYHCCDPILQQEFVTKLHFC